VGLTYIAVDHYFCRTNKNLNLDVYGRGHCDLGFLVLFFLIKGLSCT
jgi:hypothetical protein